MRFAVTKEHLDVFYRKRYITFDHLLPPQEVRALEGTLEECLVRRLKHRREAGEVYVAGYDSWREDPLIKKVVCSPRLAEIAAQLTKSRTIRIAHDQILVASPWSIPLFQRPMTLQELSSIQDIQCGLMLQLAAVTPPDDPLPREPGSGTFFSPRFPLCFDYLSSSPHLTQLLIFYAGETALYTHTPTDPHTHQLKKLGYAFGDLVRLSTHPVLFKPYA